MKKKILSISLVVALLATGLIGATLAYFTDTDYAKNVMTTGNVKIKQLEEQRYYDDNGDFWTLGDFVQNQGLYPMVDSRVEDASFMTSAEVPVAGDENTNVFNEGFKNDIDKFISVTNIGTEDAYIRTLLAFETVIQYEENTDNEINLHDIYFLVNGTFDYLNVDGDIWEKGDDAMVIEIDGTEYWIAECVYENPIAPEVRTPTSLRQIGLTWDAGNEVVDLFGETYEILAISQATQTQGFKNAEDALTAAFGEINKENATKWFTEAQ